MTVSLVESLVMANIAFLSMRCRKKDASMARKYNAHTSTTCLLCPRRVYCTYLYNCHIVPSMMSH